MSVVLTQTAADQRRAVRDYLARSRPAHAQALAGWVTARAAALDGRSQSGAEVTGYGDADIREVFEHSYRILYRVSGPDVQVIAVLHSSRRLPRTPPN